MTCGPGALRVGLEECGVTEVDKAAEPVDNTVMHDGTESPFDSAMAAHYGDDAVPFSNALDAVARDMPNALKMLEES